MRIVPASAEAVAEAAQLILNGELVGMPTETVYGIAANALNPEAVARTFAAKGRPPENPLIVHVANVEWLDRVASPIPESALLLAEQFWPGPLTLVLYKQSRVPDVTTAGLNTVAVRAPSHPVARALISSAGVPLSAPSANPFGALSPTRAESIAPELGDQLAMILDGGPCEVGIESTVLDLTSEKPTILRPGRVSRTDIEGVLSREVDYAETRSHKSPGNYDRHYAPRTPTQLTERLTSDQAGLTFHTPTNPDQIHMPTDPVPYGALLYESLQKLDEKGLDQISIETPPMHDEWRAIWDRIRRATSG
jgi:L-threonylcarbamoyladenylate synthase